MPALSQLVRAQAYPTRPVTMIVPSAAGANIDTIGRIMAEPKEIITKLNGAVVEALADPSVRSQTPEALGALQRADAAKWWPMIKEFRISP